MYHATSDVIHDATMQHAIKRYSLQDATGQPRQPRYPYPYLGAQQRDDLLRRRLLLLDVRRHDAHHRAKVLLLLAHGEEYLALARRFDQPRVCEPDPQGELLRRLVPHVAEHAVQRVLCAAGQSTQLNCRSVRWLRTCGRTEARTRHTRTHARTHAHHTWMHERICIHTCTHARTHARTCETDYLQDNLYPDGVDEEAAVQPERLVRPQPELLELK